ncbi:MAG: hypothetical protein HY851_04195, partial [candidate division Zixibacteria bacterium]|nr:hypothetical protein [candidate division Zixibacteria bacterium]
MKNVAVLFVAAALFAAIAAGAGCRVRTVEPDDYQPAVSGHLNPVEARQLVTLLLARHGIKLQPNSELNLRGVRILADGFDPNLHIGYVYLLNPPPGAKLDFAVQTRPSAGSFKVLEKIEKTEHTYVGWIDEGTAESITAQIETFVERLYKTGALARSRGPKKDEEAQAAKDGKDSAEGGETGKADPKKDDEKKDEGPGK